jgi:6-phosphogluconolactonase
MALITIANKNLEQLNKQAVDVLVSHAQQFAAVKENVVLGIPGGRSVQGIFAWLRKETRMPWKQTHVFLVDERIVALDHSDSNYRLARESFIDALVEQGALPKENTHSFRKEFGSIAYQKELHKFGGRFDIVLLGVGEDCHIGALFPKHHSIGDTSSGFITMQDAPKPPAERMTASRALLLQSEVALALFIGEQKRAAYEQFLRDGPVEACPARLVKQIQNAHVITDLA